MSKVKEVNDSKNEEVIEKVESKETSKEESKKKPAKATTRKSTGTKSKTTTAKEKEAKEVAKKDPEKKTKTTETAKAKKVATKTGTTKTKTSKTVTSKATKTKVSTTKKTTAKTTKANETVETKKKETKSAKVATAKAKEVEEKVTSPKKTKSTVAKSKVTREISSKENDNQNEEEVLKNSDENLTSNVTLNNEEDETKVLEENIEIKEENINPSKKTNKRKIVVTLIFAVVLVAIMMFSTMFAIVNRNTNKIVSNVYVQGVSIAGLTKEDAKVTITKMYENKLKQDIILKHEDYETLLSPEQIEASFGIDEVIDMAYSIGRSGKLLKDNYAIIGTKINKTDIKPSFTYNEKLIQDFVSSESENLPDKVQQSSYSIDGNKLIITKGKKGYAINEEELKQDIIDNITNLKPETETIEMQVHEVEPNKIDLQKIHDEIYKEAKDAYYTKSPFTVYPHENGVDFAVSMEEANNLLNSGEEEVIIPLKITVPKVTINQIGQEAFPDLLATYSTKFSTSNVNRTTNIRLAVNKINGVVVMPGKQFSYNAVLGQRTASAGYKSAAVYVSGRVENGIGGGICQVSSTLYNTALRANLEIIKRSNHMFATGYVPLSTDATVSWGGPEFIFKNSRKYPIKIVASVNGGTIKVDIFGHKEDVEYEVVIKSETIQTIPMQTEYRTNTSLPAGTTKTVQKGHGGYKSRAYRILKLNGKVVSTQLLSTDTYRQLSTIIEKN